MAGILLKKVVSFVQSLFSRGGLEEDASVSEKPQLSDADASYSEELTIYRRMHGRVPHVDINKKSFSG